jgi:NAD+ synthase
VIGYFTKYGDGGADVIPEAGFTKQRSATCQASHPKRINQRRVPLPLGSQTAEGELGINYEQLDIILLMMVDRKREEKNGRPPWRGGDGASTSHKVDKQQCHK